MTRFSFLSDGNRERYLRLIEPVANLFVRFHVHPNVLTLLGLILSGAAAVLYGTGNFFWAAWVVVLAGTCDVLDGLLARITGKASRFGAFFDSSLDRFSEVFLFLGLAWYFSGGHLAVAVGAGNVSSVRSPVAVLFIVLAIGGSFMVSYTRARAEGLGIECKTGFMQRPERMVLLIIGSLLASLPTVGPWIMKTCLFLLALLSNFTALQRMVHVKKQLIKEMDSGER
ncbi:MAG: CDP-alcohol phosphatidyltransferase family protein [Deltaproteobacteria bacterium]|nr:MAG: CDP-alcohol phosphatidyltransferase family protein [Deltaproteobacteria bacterium]